MVNTLFISALYHTVAQRQRAESGGHVLQTPEPFAQYFLCAANNDKSVRVDVVTMFIM